MLNVLMVNSSWYLEKLEGLEGLENLEDLEKSREASFYDWPSSLSRITSRKWAANS